MTFSLHEIMSDFFLYDLLQDEMNKIILLNVGISWLVGCFGLNGPLRQYFSLYRAVSQREGERKEK